MTTDQFVSDVTVWAAALVTVAPIVATAYFKIRAEVEKLKAQQQSNSQRIDIHDAQSNINTAAIVATPQTTTTNPK